MVHRAASLAGRCAHVGLLSRLAWCEKYAARQLEVIAESLRNDFVKVTTLQLSGSPVMLISEQAAKCDADYIVMGSHGHTAFYDLLVGSTTHGVLNRGKCPVVIVPPAKETPKVRKLARLAAVD